MVAEGDYVAVFQSMHRVMKAEKILKDKGFAVRLIPAPRTITADCGLALQYGPDIRDAVDQALAAAALLPYDRYVKDGGYRLL